MRERAQRDFVTDRVPVVVATNAFGMGIDKSNVRYVIHHNMPESIEAYYQEAGRAGRDGEPSRCTLLWNESDIVTRRRLLDSDYENERLTPDEQEVVRRAKRRLLDAMVGYCRTTDCLHIYMTRYFGENDTVGGTSDGKCAGGCANCEHTFETVDVTETARAISRCVHDVNQNVGMGKIVKILRGSKAQDLSYLNPESMPTFGMLEGVSEARIRDVLSQMATDGFLFISEGRLPIVKFGTRAAETVAPGFHYEIKKIERTSPTKRGGAAHGTSYEAGDEISSTAVGSYIPDDDAEALFQRLRELRLDIAREIGKPPYIVFSDRTLRDMARIRPVTNAQFLAVNGVGDNKLRLYGERFMNLIRSINAG
ncbi:HRDC domain protein [Bifidobacterium dentium JCVIHMP022]|uniref:ATP-dependent DNA helicase RecQ n=1 Tax=Bifidobacterium dentium JCVIHMP022 TaxID=553191 RepID=A0AB72YZ11_9BIFI|nr:HRDC domain protein [Bifidobacterium dentium JCVIHMP022]